MTKISKVVLAGATGNLGPAVLDALVDAGFEVTVLTRKSGDAKLKHPVKVAQVDYTSLDSLTSALQGQDAVVSTLTTEAAEAQLLLVQAAAKANIKRFIPSEFGSDTLNEKAQNFPPFQGKIAVQGALKKASSSGMSYTLVVTGPFLDWGIQIGFIMNVKERSISLFDGGERKFSATRLSTIGKATASVLKHLDETENRAVYVQDTAISLKQLAAMGKKATGSDDWKESVVPVDALLAEAWSDPGKHIFSFIVASIWGEGYGTPFPKLDNELLGIEQMSDAEVQEVVNRYAA